MADKTRNELAFEFVMAHVRAALEDPNRHIDADRIVSGSFELADRFVREAERPPKKRFAKEPSGDDPTGGLSSKPPRRPGGKLATERNEAEDKLEGEEGVGDPSVEHDPSTTTCPMCPHPVHGLTKCDRMVGDGGGGVRICNCEIVFPGLCYGCRHKFHSGKCLEVTVVPGPDNTEDKIPCICENGS